MKLTDKTKDLMRKLSDKELKANEIADLTGKSRNSVIASMSVKNYKVLFNVKSVVENDKIVKYYSLSQLGKETLENFDKTTV